MIQGAGAALLTLATGSSKAQAAVAGLGAGLTAGLLGPLGLVAGLAVGATKALYLLTQGWGKMGMSAAKQTETVINQLRVMLKGVEAAKQRIRELRSFSVESPFRVSDIIQGDRAMQSLTKGALNNREGLRQVGDAAAQAGVGFNDMAVYVGRLYDGLSANRPVGEVLFRLAELGVISGTARNAIEKLQESGAGFGEVWAVVETQLARSKGTMAFTSKTLEGMEETLEDTKESIKATFSTNFMEGQKQAVEANIQTLENLRPAVEGLGSAYGGVVSVTNTLTARFLAWATSLPGVASGMEYLGRFVGVLTASLVGLIGLVGGAGLLKWLPAVGTAAMAAARGLLGMAGAAGILKGVTMSLMGPIALLVVAAMALATYFWQQSAAVEKATQAMREYAGATEAVVARMQGMISAIQTLDQLSQAYQQTLQQLRAAYEDEAAAAEAGDKKKVAAARERVQALKALMATMDAVNRDSLEMDPFVADTRRGVAEGARDSQRAEVERQRATMTPQQLAESLAQEQRTLEARRAKAEQELAGQEKFRKDRAGTADALGVNQTEQIGVKQRLDEKRREFNSDGGVDFFKIGPEVKALADELERLGAEEVALLEKQLDLAEASGSEIAVLQEKLSIYERYKTAVQAVADSQVALTEAKRAEASEESEARITQVTRDLEEQERVLKRLEVLKDKSGMNPRSAQEAAGALETAKGQVRQDAANTPEAIAARARAEDARRRAERARAEAAVDLEEAEGGQGGSLAAAQAGIDAERKRLEIAREYDAMDEQVYNRRKKMLEIDQQKLDLQKLITKQQMEGEFNAGGLDLEAKIARAKGRGKEARGIEEKAKQAREEAERESRVREKMDKGMSEGDARGQVDQEINRDRKGRAIDEQAGILQSLLAQRPVADSMARIGGGGGVYAGGGDVRKVTDRLDRLIEAVKAQRQAEMTIN